MGKIMICDHCGNKLPKNIVANYENTEYDYEDSEWEKATYKLYLCPVCKHVTLECETLYSEDAHMIGHLKGMDYDIELEKITNIYRLYPENSYSNNNIPNKVVSAFESALRVRNIDPVICAMAIRRTLEMICIEQGEDKGSLFDKLSNLSNKNILPPILKDMATVLREAGNAAAHEYDKVFSNEIIPPMIEFTKIIMDYIYILPNEIRRIQEKIKDKTDE